MKKLIMKIATNILTSECTYKKTYRNGYICGFGKGRVAYIEDHKNELSIITKHFSCEDDLNRYDFISDLITVESASSTEIKDYVSVEKDDDTLDLDLVKIAKQKLYFGYKINELELTKSDINSAVNQYYKKRVIKNKQIFGY